MRFRSLSAIVACVVLATLAFTVSASGASADGDTGLYIVQMKLDPVAGYEGGVAGIPATKPGKGQKIDRKSAAVQRYVGHLQATHDQALQTVGAEKVYDYTYAYNGFAAELTDVQVTALRKQAGVAAVFANEVVSVDTSSTPSFLGLDADGGIWSKLQGPSGYGSKGGAGEDIIIGVVDSGIWPDSMSFTDRKLEESKLGKVTYGPVAIGAPPAGWAGTCQAGEQFAATDCNNKLIGARYYNANYGGDAGINNTRPWEFNSPRDYHGHGTHTASTAGGNHGVPATGAAAAFGKTSGIAPRARIAAYKALWSTEDGSTASGGTVDLAAAIDQAVADGVDVINYSVSGTQSNFQDPVQIAFMWAAEAGIFVSTSAGNSGPTAGTVAHPSPWLTTVAAETHDRVGKGAVTIDGTSYEGASAGTGSATGQLVTFGTASTSTAAASNDRLCLLGSLTPAAAGKIVFCERGVNARIEKSFEVQRVGGIGIVLVNPPAGGSLNADLHFVPGVHLQGNHYAAIEAAALAGKTASIAGEVLYGQPAPFVAAFSSRGPSPAASGDLLKPDLGAPGQDILASVAPPANRGRDFDLYSGTSMSAPHVAGLAALMKQLHPDWSPMAIKSALMTTGTDILDTFTDTATANAAAQKAFAQGAGHVQPNAAMNPGLVYDSNLLDWVAFMCGSSPGYWTPASCTFVTSRGYSTKATDVNTPSISVARLAGTYEVTRKVTNVDKKAATYTASASVAGVGVTVTPSTLELAPGETKSFTVTLTQQSGTLNQWTAGSLTWTDAQAKRSVRIPIAARPVALAVPAEVSGNGAPISWTAMPGYTGALTHTVRGLVPATTQDITLAQDQQLQIPFAVGAGAIARVGVYEDAITPEGTDLDLYLYRCAPGCSLVGQASDGDSNEEITHINTGAAATYIALLHGYDTNGPSANVRFFRWVVGSADAGNTTVSGVGPATTSVPQTHTATFTGLAAGTRYLGAVEYRDGAPSLIGRTLVSVRTP